jgi:PEP-CTERM motif
MFPLNVHPRRGCAPGQIARRGTCVPIIALCVAALGLLSASPVSAGQVLTADAKGGFGNLIGVNVTFNGGSGFYYAGIQTASLDGQVWFDAYCVDLYHDNFVPVSYPVTLLPIATLSSTPISGPGATGGNGAGVGYLYDKDAPGASNDRVKAAALQVAIWTLEYGGAFADTDTPLVNGTLQQQVAYQANLYLTDYTNNHVGAPNDATWFKANPHNGVLYQDLVGPGTVTVTVATPEPSTVLAAGIGILASLGLCWRRQAARAGR